MLVIRDAQMRALADDARRRYDAAFLRHVRRGMPSAVEAHGDALPAKVEAALRRASSHGVDRFAHLALFVGLVLHDERFFEADRTPWAARILARPGLDAEARMELLGAELQTREAMPPAVAALLATPRGSA